MTLKYWAKRTDAYAKIFPILHLSYKGGLCRQCMQLTFLPLLLEPQVPQKDQSLKDAWDGFPTARQARDRGVNDPAKSYVDFTNGGLAT